MPASDDEHSSSSAEGSDSFVDGDDPQDEQEEDVSDSGSSGADDDEDEDDHGDVREDVKSERHDGSLRSGSSTGWKFGEDVAFSENNRSGEFAVDKKDAEILSEKSSFEHCRKLNSDSNLDLYDSKIMNSKSANLFGANNGKEMVAATLINNCVGRKDILHPEDEINQTDIHSGDAEKPRAPRLAGSEIEKRSLSPDAEVKGQTKRLAVICDFYAKGWCIKGSSCRFLHIKDHLNNDLLQREGNVAAGHKREVQLEGLRETTQRSRSPSFHDPLAPSVGKNSAFSLHFSSERIQPQECIESKGSHKFHEIPKFSSLQREEVFPLSFNDVGRDGKSKNRSANDSGHGSLTNRDGSIFRDSSCPEYAGTSSGHIISPANYRFMSPPSRSRSVEVEEWATIESQRTHSYQTSLTSHSPNLSSSTSLLTTGMLSSNRISAWTGSSLPFSYSSLNTSPLASRSSSLLHCSSHLSGCEPENLPSTKRKISSNDWEPSVPFQPSFLVRSMISSTGSQYDPLRDSVELRKLGDISVKASLFSQGSSIVNTLHHQNHGNLISETPGLACNDDTKSVSSHNTYCETMLDKSCQTHGKDMRTTDLEVVGSSTGWQNGKMPKKENSLSSSDVKDITEATSDGRRQKHRLKDCLDVKADNVRQNNEMDAGHIVESKSLRQFRAALIDLVKEKLKPKWREGHLSKDAHNKIVRKAVEKVLSTLQPQQVPTSMESIKQYLASSRLKIDKLVEGYADIYGKV